MQPICCDAAACRRSGQRNQATSSYRDHAEVRSRTARAFAEKLQAKRDAAPKPPSEQLSGCPGDRDAVLKATGLSAWFIIIARRLGFAPDGDNKRIPTVQLDGWDVSEARMHVAMGSLLLRRITHD